MVFQRSRKGMSAWRCASLISRQLGPAALRRSREWVSVVREAPSPCSSTAMPGGTALGTMVTW